MRKIIQIFKDTFQILFLCDDGTVWTRDSIYEFPESGNGLAYKIKGFEWRQVYNDLPQCDLAGEKKDKS